MPYTPAIDSAAFYTVQYFQIGKIADYMNKMAGKLNFGYLDGWVDFVFDWHKIMQTEIDQHIHGSTENMQNQYFEHVRYVSDIVNTWHDGSIIRAIDKYNLEAETRFYKDIEEKADAFRKSNEFLNRTHKEEWEEDPPENPFFGGIYKSYFKTKKIHYKWYIVEGGPEVLDVSYTQQYLELVNKIADNFKRIVNATLKLWDEKKIKSNATASIQILQPQGQTPFLLNSTQQEIPSEKLKTTLTSGQILYLFKTLKSLDVFGSVSNVDLCRFIARHICTKDTDQLSADNLAKVWSNIDPNDISYWYEQYPEMVKVSVKDNHKKLSHKGKKTN
jgi:hypothetical protein